jgi:hypothetical protein
LARLFVLSSLPLTAVSSAEHACSFGLIFLATDVKQEAVEILSNLGEVCLARMQDS